MTESANAAIRYELATGDQDNLTVNASDFDHNIRICILIIAQPPLVSRAVLPSR